ncbi:MAG: hypothetical protein WC595_05530 [Candidatus Nanoarchaeia archaeon]
MKEYILRYANELCSNPFYLYEIASGRVLIEDHKFSEVLSHFIENYAFKGSEPIRINMADAIPKEKRTLVDMVVRVHNKIVARKAPVNYPTSLVEAALDN